MVNQTQSIKALTDKRPSVASRFTAFAPRQGKNRLKILLFLLPALVPLVLFSLYPIFRTATLSTTDWDYVSPSYNNVGAMNYEYMFNNPIVRRTLGVTALFTVASLVISMVIGLMLAMAIRNNRFLNQALKFMYFSPWVTPVVAVSIVWVFMFDKQGIINYVGSLFGGTRIDWLGSSGLALIPIIVVTVWMNLGWNMIFYLGSLSKIPKDLFEAADVDGVTGIYRLVNIILPLVSPTTLFLTVLNTINFLQTYTQIDIMTGGGPAESTQNLVYLFYKYAFSYFEVGRASTLAMILLAITAVLSALQFVISKKLVYYN